MLRNIVFSCVVGACAGWAQVRAGDEYVQLASLNTPRQESAADLLRGRIYVVGGLFDIFQRSEELDEVLTFVRSSAQRLLGISPEVFPVSARLAMRAKQGEPSAWAASRFEALERYIRETLDHGSRFRLKLANPIGVGQALAHRYATIADERLALLKEDVALLEDIERQLAVHRADLMRGFELRMIAVEKVLPYSLESAPSQCPSDSCSEWKKLEILA